MENIQEIVAAAHRFAIIANRNMLVQEDDEGGYCIDWCQHYPGNPYIKVTPKGEFEIHKGDRSDSNTTGI